MTEYESPSPVKRKVNTYQLDFRTPGISPFRLSNRKQILHIRNRRKNPRTRPQISHR